jgi:hypothetical protein
MLYFPYGRTQAYRIYRWNGSSWELKRTGTHLIDRRIYDECQVFLSSWLNKNVQHSTSNGVNADLAIGSQAPQKACSIQ